MCIPILVKTFKVSFYPDTEAGGRGGLHFRPLTEELIQQLRRSLQYTSERPTHPSLSLNSFISSFQPGMVTFGGPRVT